MFVNEVRFYREIAPIVGVRVPECSRAEERAGATVLELENLADWEPAADPVAAAQNLRVLHDRWAGGAFQAWPWLRRPAQGVDLVGANFDKVWEKARERTDCLEFLRAVGDRLLHRVPEAEAMAARVTPHTLCHGDASFRNMRTNPETGEIALLDWEDVSIGAGVGDLAWMLVSSVDPEVWEATIEAYSDSQGLGQVLPAVCVQGIFMWADTPVDSPESQGWTQRLGAAVERMW
jgi:hypothetical protein